jgi:hypothetical protein
MASASRSKTEAARAALDVATLPVNKHPSSLRGAEGDAAIHLQVAAARWIASSLRSSQ